MEELWQEKFENRTGYNTLLPLINSGKCIVFKTADEEYTQDEIEFDLIEADEIFEYTESIPVAHVPASSGWVKKKADRKCVSDDPEDCLVWCKVDVEESYTLDAISGIKYEMDACPTDFLFNDYDSTCERTTDFPNETSQPILINILDKKSGDILDVVSWEILECD